MVQTWKKRRLVVPLCALVACSSGNAGPTSDAATADSGDAASSPDAASTDSGDAAASETSVAALEQEVLGSWTHAREEDNSYPGESQVFRPSDSREWPPLMFRQTIEFATEGQCQRLVLHPADAHFMTPCQWQVDPTQADKISVSSPDGDAVARLRVVEIGPNILRLEQLSGPGLGCYCEFTMPGA